MNIVFSTTKQWNPGDELILTGIRNLLGDHTYIMYNRHPHILNNAGKLYEKSGRVGDNSWYLGMGDELVDHVIFAGSPEYHDIPNSDLYALIDAKDTPFSYIGVGGPPLSPRPYEKASVCFTRDRLAATMPNAILAPCPSIFAVKDLNIKPRVNKEKIAFCFQSGLKYICSPNEDVHQASIKFINEYKPTVCCHSFPDYVEAVSRGWDPFYSARMEDYFDFYSEFDVVVGTRIHGAGWAANYGIPSITIHHDNRIEAAAFFGSIITQASLLDKAFEDLNVPLASKYIIDLRKSWLGQYREKLEPIFGVAEGWDERT